MNKVASLIIALLVLAYVALFFFTAVDLTASIGAGGPIVVHSAIEVENTADGAVVLDIEGEGFTKDIRVFTHFDVNNRAAVVGSFPVNGMVFDMERMGDLLFVASLVDGLRIFDVSDPLKPVMRPDRNAVNTLFMDIERQGKEFFFSCGTQGVRIGELSDKGRLRDWKKLPTYSAAVGSAVVDRKLYVAASRDGLLVYDLEHLEDSRPIAKYKTEYSLRQIEAYGRYLYTVFASGGVWIYQLDENGLPVKVGTIPSKRYVKSVSIFEDKLYLLENNRLAMFDLSEPASPELISEQTHFSSPQRLFRFGQQLFVADNYSGLGVVDVVGGQLSSSARFMNLGGDSRAVAMVDNFLYIAVANQGIKIIDPSKIKPRQVVNTIEGPGLVRDILFLGDYAYIADSVEGVSFLKLGDASPKRRMLCNGENSFLALAGNHLFVSSRESGFRVFDVADAANPELVADWESIKGNPVVSGSNLVLGKGKFGLELWDISNYTSPRMLDKVDDVLATQVVLQDDLAFIAGEREGVGIYRIAGGRLEFLSQLQLPFPLNRFSSALKCVVRGKMLFVVNGDAGLMIVDIKKPEEPKILSSLRLPGQSSDLMVEGERVYLLSRYSGLNTVDVSDLHNPRLLDSLPLSDVWRGMQRKDDLFYLGNRLMGVTAIPFPAEVENVERISSERLRVTVPKQKYAGRYSLHVGNAKESVDLEGVVSFH